VSWQERAACGGAPTDLFFPVQGGNATRDQCAEALAWCARCPVTSRCLTDAVSARAKGVWGGMTEKEREAMIRNQRRRESAARKRQPEPDEGEAA
jgi:WhiB family transcriptional regulator, redox-sensing transcriptional regulator